MSDYRFRVRRYEADGTRRGVIGWSKLRMDDVYSDVSSCELTISEKVSGSLPSLFFAAVEWSAGGEWSEVARFTFSNRKADRADASGTVTVSGIECGPWFLQRLLMRNLGIDDRRNWLGEKTPGDVLTDLVSEGKTRGWGFGVSIGFTRSKFSDGQPITKMGLSGRDFTGPAPVQSILEKLAEQFGVEWSWDGLKLDLWGHGTGTDRPGVRLGTAASRAPSTESWDNVYTDLAFKLDRGERTYVITDAPRTYGALEATVELGGVTPQDMADSYATIMHRSAAPKRAATIVQDASSNGPLPYADYRLGDKVRVFEGEWVPRRVVSVTVEATADGKITIAPAVGDRFDDALYRLSKDVSNSSGGAISTGSGAKPKPPELVSPGVPSGVTVQSEGRWEATGQPVSDVTIGWDETTRDANGNPMVVDRYIVYGYETAAGVAHMRSLGETSGLSLTVEQAPGVQWSYAVAARSQAGSSWGDLSAWVSHTGEAPEDVLQPPSAPTVESSMSVIRVSWDGMLGNGAPPLNFRSVRVETAPAEAGPWTDAGRELRTSGTVLIAGTVGETVWVRWMAVSTMGQKGPNSDPTSVTVEGVSLADLNDQLKGDIIAGDGMLTMSPDAPTVADGADKDVNAVWMRRDQNFNVTAQWVWDGTQWQSQQVESDVIANLDVGKLTAGVGDFSAVVVGKLLANQAMVGAITTSMLAAGVGGELDLSGNAITITAENASADAVNAQTAADTALDAARDAFDAAGYGRVEYSQPADGETDVLWVDVSDGNTPKRWVGDGTPSKSVSHIFDTGTIRTNICENPVTDSTVDTTGWWASTNASGIEIVTRDDGVALRCTASAVGTAVTGVGKFDIGDADAITISAEISPTDAPTVFLSIWWVDGDGNLSVSVASDTVASAGSGEWVTVTMENLTPPAGTVGVRVYSRADVIAAGETFDTRHVLIEATDTVADYFDGDTEGAWWGDGSWQPVSDQLAADGYSNALDALQNAVAAQNAADAAQATADSAQATADETALVLRITSEYAEFTRPSSNNAVRIDDESVRIRTGQVVGTELTAGRLTVPQIFVQGGVIGNHTVSNEFSGQTVFRSL